MPLRGTNWCGDRSAAWQPNLAPSPVWTAGSAGAIGPTLPFAHRILAARVPFELSSGSDQPRLALFRLAKTVCHATNARAPRAMTSQTLSLSALVDSCELAIASRSCIFHCAYLTPDLKEGRCADCTADVAEWVDVATQVAGW